MRMPIKSRRSLRIQRGNIEFGRRMWKSSIDERITIEPMSLEKTRNSPIGVQRSSLRAKRTGFPSFSMCVVQNRDCRSIVMSRCFIPVFYYERKQLRAKEEDESAEEESRCDWFGNRRLAEEATDLQYDSHLPPAHAF